MPLTRIDAEERARIVSPTQYVVDVDLTHGAQEFESHTRLTFTATPGGFTFAEIDAVLVHSVTLNGATIPVDAIDDRRIPLRDLKAENELIVSARMRYSHDGQGLHRASDPADGHEYIYGHLFMDAAPRVFACFDQPDLKAPYEFSVTAPAQWTVLTNAPMQAVSTGGEHEPMTRWTGRQDKPLATYFVTICAGPYASVTGEHDGIPLGIHVRKSLEKQLTEQAPDILKLTADCFDYYHQLFGIRYPFGAYHQVFVPEFNAGAMENPGCITLRDQMIFTGTASHSERMDRANTIAHEMAHMWFGDLVTMQWWDDLWLNESFAEYMAGRTLVETGAYPDAWVAVAAGRKSWGYAADRSPSTHPIAGAPAPDTDTALQNFDGISYAKGAAALRQMILTVGDEAFIAGVRAHLREHSFSNATLAQFLGHIDDAADVDLSAWVDAWLTTAGMDDLHVETADGHTALVMTEDQRFPKSRQHVLSVGAFSAAGELVASDDLHSVSGHVRLPKVSAAVAGGSAIAVIPNTDDRTWAGVRFDDEGLDALASVLPGVASDATRAMVWTALAHGVARTTLSPQAVLAFAEKTLPHETQVPILDVASNLLTQTVIGRYLRHADRPDAAARVAGIGQRLLAAGNNDQALAGARLFAATGDVERLLPWFNGENLPAMLVGDTTFRWRVAHTLAAHDAVSIADLDAALEADVTMSGQLGYLTARAARPTSEDKAWAWQELTAAPTPDSPAHSNYEMNALATGFFSSGGEDLLTPYVERYVNDIPAMRAWVGEDALARVASLAFPRQLSSDLVEIEARRMLDTDLPASVARAVIDQHAGVVEVLASRNTFAPTE